MFPCPRSPSSSWLAPSFSKASHHRATPQWRCFTITFIAPLKPLLLRLPMICLSQGNDTGLHLPFTIPCDLGQCRSFFPSWSSLCPVSLTPSPCVGSYFSDSFFPLFFVDISSAYPTHANLDKVLGDLIHTRGLNDHMWGLPTLFAAYIRMPAILAF